MPQSDTELGAEIRAARRVPQVGAVCRKVSESLGFRYFQYGFRIPISLTRPCQIILSGYPKEWRTHYDDRGYLTMDPTIRRGLGTVVPFGWDELVLETPQERQLFAEAAEHGLKHGFSVPVHGAYGDGAMFSFARPEPLPEAGGLERQGLFQRAQWFTALVHERLRDLANEELAFVARRKSLTRRERECLQHAADGQTAAIIGRDMHISEHTVNFHLSNAEAKLGARSRRHAVVRAVTLGEIAPGCYPPQLRQSQEVVEFRIF